MISTILFASLVVNDKEARARANVEPKIRAYAKAVGIQFPPRQLLLRVFKDEKKMEVWGGKSATSPLSRLVKYTILAAAGELGPKRQYGDRQVPEGLYYVDRFNPNSSYHLSLGINYPNASDRILATSSNPGADIFIHGNQLSDGCLAMGDPAIEEIYTMARMAKEKVVVLILPSKKIPDPANLFWAQIYSINAKFEIQHIIPRTSIDQHGNYHVR